MTVTLYKTGDPVNKVVKTLTGAKVHSNVVLKEGTDVLTPVLLLEETDLALYNYCYIQEFARYYWIKPKNFRNGLWEVVCSVDPLMSWSVPLLNQKVTVDRNAYEKNGYLYDMNYKALCYRSYIIKNFPNAIDEDTLYLQTVG